MMGWLRRSLLAGAAVAWLIPGAVPAQDRAAIDRLSDALLLPEVVDVLRAEGLRYGESLNEDMLGGKGGGYFADQVSRLYDAGAMLEVLRASLAKGMSEAHVAESLAFFDTDRGRRILQLEVSARVAMADPAVDEMAEQAVAAARSDGDARLDAVTRFIEINDLNERNVAGALSSNYQFFRGLVEGGSHQMSEDEILTEVWSQEEDIRSETLDWLNSFLFMAYGPLEAAEMQAYLDYSDTPAGQSMNAALFDGFDEIYRTIYFALGLAVAQSLQVSEL